jgi:C-terminal processing protease CtpA/Prc
MMPAGFEPRSKEKAGIGITSGRINNNDLSGALYILAVHPNGAAAKTGKLEPMQELVSVDGWPVLGQPMHVITERVVGVAGTLVTLEVNTCSCLGFCS